ncbi:protein FAM83H [Chanos chanos]|uniref:Protein FAM83H n=1 Tax=Chanos chanos TaxID=29144 RepID=A0A6J2WLD5_CHACN|nr:protein FAM83H [Chanos chanos]
MPHRSQSSSVGDNPLDPNYVPPHYREEYRLAIDALVEEDVEGYYGFLQNANMVEFLAQPEIEHIKRTVQVPQSAGSVPELTYHETDQDGSSDTYWPLHSDLDAPGLDLGWPLPQHSFVGPTEVITLVNPSDPEMPSIKEQVRRLIKNAQQVIAIVMDMFTDIDIFSDLLNAAARHVAVYILLDEQNSHHFLSMVTSCKVNLEMIPMMRVRTVAGITYFCRTGKSFKGQMMDRFLLVDCRAVLSGNYSFMWSFEKIHRCMAHQFSGELVSSFDEEFRILFAQSQPLVIESALVPVPPDNAGGYLGNHGYGLKRSQSFRHQRGFMRHTELSGFPFGDRLDSALPFRREEPFRHGLETGAGAVQISRFASQQFKMQQSFLDQGRSIMASRQLEMNAYKRHSYAEGTRESYSSARQYMKQRVMNNLEEMESHYQREQHLYQSEGLGPGSGRYEPLRNRSLHQLDQYSDSGYPPELEAPGNYNVLTSDDLRHDPGSKHHHQDGGRYGSSSQKRPSVGQPYVCQSSPTRLHPPDQKHQFPPGEQERQSQDHNVRQGLRNWRINSYLSANDDAGEEGLSQPLGPDTFDEPEQQSSELSSMPIKPLLDLRPRFGKPILPVKDPGKETRSSSSDQVPTGSDSQMIRAVSNTSLASSVGTESEKETELRDTKQISITKHESFRSRINPMLQRSSRLRSSLIFSSSKLEQHSATLGKPDGDLQEEGEPDPLKTSSIVASILEKRRSFSREPFDWSRHKKTDTKDKEDSTSSETTKQKEEATESISEEPPKESKEKPKSAVLEKQPETKTEAETLEIKPLPALNMNDPASRLQYFKELAAKRKTSRTASESSSKSQEPASKKQDISATPPGSTEKNVSVFSAEPTPKKPEAPTVLTDPVAKPPVPPVKPKPSEPSADNQRKSSMETLEVPKKEPAKEPTKSLKPFPSPKFFKRDTLKPSKGSHSRRISCGEEILTDATDSEKSELKKSRSHSSSSMPRSESKESLPLSRQGSNTSLNMVGSDSKDTKALDFLKKQTQRLKGFLGPKGEKKSTSVSGPAEDKQMKTVPEMSEEPSKKGKETRTDSVTTSGVESNKSTAKPGHSRYQSSNVLFSSNLRDDTKVILEQISANSQKNRLEQAKQAEEAGNGSGGKDHGSNKDDESSTRYQIRNRFSRPQANPQERDSLLQRIESMRKEKKVYSRFEMGNNLG